MKQENKIKKKIKLARIEANLTQTELAKKVKSSQQSVVAWEKGSFIPSLENIKKIAKATGRNLNYFFDNSISGNQNISGNNNTQNINDIELLKKDIAILQADQKRMQAELELIKLKLKK